MLQRLRAWGQGTLSRLLKIPWILFIVTVFKEMGRDDASTNAAAVSYYAFLSIFPLAVGIIAILGLFLPQQNIQQSILDFIDRNLPASADIVKQTITSVISSRGALGIISIAGLIWTGTAMFSAATHAINRAWDVERDRPWPIKKARELGMSLGVGLLFLLSLGTTLAVSLLRNTGLPQVGTLAEIGSVVLNIVLIFAIFVLVYKFVPNTHTGWRDIWPGAAVAALLFEAARYAFVFYLSNFSNYQVVYGALASIVILLVWVYYSAFILILGAEISAELNHLHQRPEPNVDPKAHTPQSHDERDKKPVNVSTEDKTGKKP